MIDWCYAAYRLLNNPDKTLFNNFWIRCPLAFPAGPGASTLA